MPGKYSFSLYNDHISTTQPFPHTYTTKALAIITSTFLQRWSTAPLPYQEKCMVHAFTLKAFHSLHPHYHLTAIDSHLWSAHNYVFKMLAKFSQKQLNAFSQATPHVLTQADPSTALHFFKIFFEEIKINSFFMIWGLSSWLLPALWPCIIRWSILHCCSPVPPVCIHLFLLPSFTAGIYFLPSFFVHSSTTARC